MFRRLFPTKAKNVEELQISLYESGMKIEKLELENKKLQKKIKYFRKRCKQMDEQLSTLVKDKMEDVDKKKNELEDKIKHAQVEKRDSVIHSLVQEKEELEMVRKDVQTKRLQSIRFTSLRGNIIREFYFSERKYVRCLSRVINGYLPGIKRRKLIPLKDVSSLFDDFERIYIVHKAFLTELESVLFSTWKEEELVELVLRFSAGLKIEYGRYIRKFSTIKEKLGELKKSRKLTKYLKNKEKQLEKKRNKRELESGMTPLGNDEHEEKFPIALSAIMLVPIPHMEKYVTLVKNLLDFTKPVSTLYKSILEMKKTLEDVNGRCLKYAQIYKMTILSRELNFNVKDKQLINEVKAEIIEPKPTRKERKRGKREKKKKERKKAKCYLFNNMVLIKEVDSNAKDSLIVIEIEEDNKNDVKLKIEKDGSIAVLNFKSKLKGEVMIKVEAEEVPHFTWYSDRIKVTCTEKDDIYGVAKMLKVIENACLPSPSENESPDNAKSKKTKEPKRKKEDLSKVDMYKNFQMRKIKADEEVMRARRESRMLDEEDFAKVFDLEECAKKNVIRMSMSWAAEKPPIPLEDDGEYMYDDY